MLQLAAETRLGELTLDVDLTVESAECLVLAGPSGAGKTSVLRLVAGLLRPTRGRVSCHDEDWLDTERGIDVPAEHRRCGYLFQEYALFPHMTALDNVAYGLQDLPRADRPARARGAARAVRRGSSGGRQAAHAGRAASASALRSLGRWPASRSVLLLDEPLSALDARTRAHASRELVELLRAAAVPALVVTHDFLEAALLGDRVGVIDGAGSFSEGRPRSWRRRRRRPSWRTSRARWCSPALHEPARTGLTLVDLDGGGTVASTDAADGRVAASVYPWEIAIEATTEPRHGSQQNRLEAEVTSLTEIGNRVRVGLAAPQPLTAEITLASAQEMRLRPGARVAATWKAAATRIVRRSGRRA